MMVWTMILKPTPYDILNIGQIGLTLHTNRSHKFILIVDFSGGTLGGIPGVLFLLVVKILTPHLQIPKIFRNLI